MLAPGLARRYERLLRLLADNPGWVAFSGGVDSSLVLRALREVNPEPVVALFADSPLQSEDDRIRVKRLAEALGVQLRVVAFEPLLRAEFVANSRERCYLCKKTIFSHFQEMLPQGLRLMDGTNSDDLGTDRPGLRALAELGVFSPLALIGLTKIEIRKISHWLALPSWNLPAASCLATRIPTGEMITSALLRHLERCEEVVRRHGFTHIRARPVVGRADDLVVELAREELTHLDVNPCRERLVAELRSLGVGKVTFAGRSGVFVRDIG